MAFAADANSRGSTIRFGVAISSVLSFIDGSMTEGRPGAIARTAGADPFQAKAPSIFFLDYVLAVIWVSGQHFAGSRARPRLPRTYAGYTGAGRVAGMCFSATASFSAASITGVIGVATLRQVKHPRELLLAAMPLLFAVQQAIEGRSLARFTGRQRPALQHIFCFSLILWVIATRTQPR